MNSSVNVLALVRDEHRYVFLYDDESADTVLNQICSYASDPEFNLTWYDAALLSQRVRRLTERAQPANSAAEDFPTLF